MSPREDPEGGCCETSEGSSPTGQIRLRSGCDRPLGVVNPASTRSAETPEAKEHKGLVGGASGLMVAGFLTTLLSPLIAVSFASEFDFGIGRAGVLVALGQSGVALSAFGVLPFLPRLDRRRVGIAGALLAAICLALTGFAAGFGLVLALQIAMGIGAGLCYACSNSALAFARFPERAFGIVTIAWMLVGAAMMALGPTLHDIWPKVGLYLGMAAAEILCIVVIMWLPDVRKLPEGMGSTESDEGPADPRIGVAAAALLVVALGLLAFGNAMIWTFAASMGERAGLAAPFTATFLGLSQLVGLIGAGVSVMLGARINKMWLIGAAVVVLALGNLLAATAASPAPFIGGFLAINAAFFCVTPLLLALAAELDTSSGRLVVLAGGSSLVAGAVAPAVGGWIAGAEGQWWRLGITALVIGLLTLPLLALPVRLGTQRTPPSAV